MPSKDFPRLSATSQRTRPRRVCGPWSRSRRRRCALGRRVATMTQEGTVRHVYDNNWQCIADVDASGNVLRSYVWGDGIDNLLAVKIGDDVYTALTDNQGTVWGFTDGNGEVVARWTYDAWGNVLSSDVTVPALAALRYRFQGREWSAVTGLMNFRMRWYDAVTGRWLSKDPIGLNGGVNLYVFCCNSPINLTDPSGRFIGSLGGFFCRCCHWRDFWCTIWWGRSWNFSRSDRWWCWWFGNGLNGQLGLRWCNFGLYYFHNHGNCGGGMWLSNKCVGWNGDRRFNGRRWRTYRRNIRDFAFWVNSRIRNSDC